MSHGWALRLSDRDPRGIASLRLVDDVEIFIDGPECWLRGPAGGECPDDSLDAILRRLAGERFEIIEHQQLVPDGYRVPRGYLPEGPWLPLRDWLTLQLPPTLLPASTDDPVRLQLIRGGAPAEANVLVTRVATWRDYAISAPQVRLQGLAFAASATEVVIRGTPLPPLRGLRMVARDGIAVPAGWTWTPAVDSSVVQAAFGIVLGDLVLWRSSDNCSHVRADNFVRASRSAARGLDPEIRHA